MTRENLSFVLYKNDRFFPWKEYLDRAKEAEFAPRKAVEPMNKDIIRKWLKVAVVALGWLLAAAQFLLANL